MISCSLCRTVSEYDKEYYSYYLSGWTVLKVSSIIDETICWQTIHICDKCTLNFKDIMDRAK